MAVFRIRANRLSRRTLLPLIIALARSDSKYARQGLATGGIVKRPTLAMAGEAGPEAIVSLGKGEGMGNVVFNIERVETSDPKRLSTASPTRCRLTGMAPG